MDGKTGKTSKIAATVVVLINLIVIAFLALLFAVGIWMIAFPSSLSTVIQSFGTPAMKTLLNPQTLTLQLGFSLALLSLFLFFVSFMGLYGAIGRSPFLLFMYSTLVLLLLLLECALLFYFSSNIMEKGLQEQDGQWTHALRLAFQCCEHNLSTPQSTTLPWSCCGTTGFPNNCTAPLVFIKNCHKTIPDWLNRYQTAIYTSLAVLHIVLSSCSIMRRSRSASHLHS